MNDRTETGLALDDGVGDTHLAAESREEHNELDGVDIVRDDDERGLLGLDKGDGMVKTVLDEERLLLGLEGVPLVHWCRVYWRVRRTLV